MVYEKKSGHIGSSFSIVEILCYLYENFELMGGKDKLVLSKGHAVPAQYAIFQEMGQLTGHEFREIDSPLQGHPHKFFYDGSGLHGGGKISTGSIFHASTGSLGQGLSIAIGMALGKKLRGEEGIVFCILGDGECQEGQVDEAFRFIKNNHVTNILPIIDVNGYQSDSKTMGMIYSELWDFYQDNIPIDMHACRDGNDIEDISRTVKDIINNLSLGEGLGILLMTQKGYPFEFMKGWHSTLPTEEQYQEAVRFLDG